MHYFFPYSSSPSPHPSFPEEKKKRAGSPVSSLVPVLQGKGDVQAYFYFFK